MRKVNAGVIQGGVLFVGEAGGPVGAPVGAAGRCGFWMRWSGGSGGRWPGWEGCIRVRIGSKGQGRLRRSGTRFGRGGEGGGTVDRVGRQCLESSG
jgi:hypothetical protein